MKENAKLRKYFITRFLLTLVIIGVIQIIISGLLRFTFTPMIERILSLNGLLTTGDIADTYKVLFESFIIFCIQKAAINISPLSRLVADKFLVAVFGEEIVATLGDLSDKVTGLAVGNYIALLLLFFIIMVIVWLIPYIVGSIIFSRTVTRKVNDLEKKRIEEEKRIELQRNLLLSDIAHDIKTPITTVAGFSKAFADGDVDEEHKQEYLNAMYAKSMQISELVNLLFDYVKLDSAGFTLKKTSEDFNEVVRGCVARLYTDFEDKGMELEINIPEEEFFVRVDRTQIERAINNILVNSIKHNPSGTKIIVDCKKIGNNVVLGISDTGTKIDREIATQLFAPFVQGDKSRTSGSGSGLGLSITKKIVDMHGGKIMLRQYLNPDKYGRVKTFEITLPQKDVIINNYYGRN